MVKKKLTDEQGVILKEQICDNLEGVDKEFTVPFTKTVWGYATITAKNKKEAEDKLDEHDVDDEFDDDSDYDFGEIEEA